jgi:alpha-methylacyl-CoA racemase
VLRLDRTVPSDLGVGLAPRFDLFMRGRSSVAVDLKHSAGAEFALKLLDAADAS